MGSINPQPADYSAPAETVTFDGLLFDMDGTIIDSTPAVVKHWERLDSLVTCLINIWAVANWHASTTASAKK